jgi:hypothetical protein
VKEISDAIHRATKRGMRVDEAACVVVSVAADYARGAYGDEYLESLCTVIRERAQHPLPPNAIAKN